MPYTYHLITTRAILPATYPLDIVATSNNGYGALTRTVQITVSQSTQQPGTQTLRTLTQLLTIIWRDGQAARSLTAQDVRDTIVSLAMQTGDYSRLPTTSVGLPAGRAWVDNGVVRIFTGTNLPVFFDDFGTLNLYDWRAPTADQVWMPATWYDPYRDGSDADGVWLVNPFNPATPFNNIYTVSGGNLVMRLDNTPTGSPDYSAAVGGDAFIGGQLQTAPSFSRLYGYFECRVAVPKVNGTSWIMWMIDASGEQEIDMIQIWTDQSGNQTGKFGIWDVLPSKSLNKYYFTYQMASPPDMTQTHTYGVFFDSTIVQFYIDRVRQAQFAMPSGYTQPMFIILQYLGAGDQSAGNPSALSLPTTAQVDYVSVWGSLPF